MKEFIMADLGRRLQELQAQEAAKLMDKDISAHTLGSNGQRFEQLSVLLQDAESKAIAREQIGPLNPHIHTLNGPRWKVFLKRVVRKFIWWFIRPVIEQQSWYNELSNSISNELRDSICLLKELAEETFRMHTELENTIAIERSKLTTAYLNKLEAMQGQIETLALEQSKLTTAHLNELETMQGQIKTIAIEQSKLTTAYLNELETVQGQIEALQKKQADAEESALDYIDYYAFEDKFRGTQEEIRSRIGRYLEYFEPGEKVLDIGCGRGEWLELLVDKGIDAIGVDISEYFIAMCQKKGLNVIHEDMFSYLESQPDFSLNGITAIQVIEHLTPAALARLVQLSYRKLKLGGRVIFETQNPKSVSTLANNFYVDPTHMRPVHPEWIGYLFKANSYTHIHFDYPEYAWVTDGSIPALSGDDESVQRFNQRISYLNNLLYGSTDYAVIAKK